MNHDHKLVRLADLLKMSQRNADFPAGMSLDSVPADLVRELKETGKLEIPFVGTFRVDAGKTKFEPAASLTEALNSTYSEFPQVSVQVIPEVVPDDVSEPLDSALSVDPPKPVSPSGPLDSSKPVSPSGPVDSSKPLTPILPDSSGVESNDPLSTVPVSEDPGQDVQANDVSKVSAIVLPELKPPIGSPPSSTPDAKYIPKRKTQESPLVQAEANPPEKPRSPRRRSASSLTREPQSSSKGILLIISGIALLIVAGILLWPILKPKPDSPSMAENNEVFSQPDSSLIQSETPNTTTKTDSLTTSGSADTTTVQNPRATLPTENSPTSSTGNQGNTITKETKGYTIIVRSALSKSVAGTAFKGLELLNLPTGVVESTKDGVTRYRSCIGVFATVELAANALQELKQQLPSDSWVFRIR